MWSNLILLHSDKSNPTPLGDDRFVVWQTCQRIVYLTDNRVFPLPENLRNFKGYDLYFGFDAYRFLLEVVSGLRSKLFGESEIQAQFRDRFHEKNLKLSTFSESLGNLRDQILEHTKMVRSKFLTGIGKQTYGGIAESYLKSEENIVFLGTGKLAEAILPYLINQKQNVRLIGRNKERLSYFKNKHSIEVYFYEDYIPKEDAIVVASSALPEHWEKHLFNSKLVIDFRENVQIPKNKVFGKYIPFSEILNNLEKTDINIKNKKLELQIFLTEITKEREEEQIHLQHGWEDLTCLI
ncbi:NAD(P)-binding domain-containing protein [Leptospira sp. 96542]|nr:NAD(P)-binding domain-containing protein [Leptospira sp. 96542]